MNNNTPRAVVFRPVEKIPPRGINRRLACFSRRDQTAERPGEDAARRAAQGRRHGAG